ncbi:helix-turn-helix transcriptional regulator [Lactococcus piscium]|uniref:helix-turn-helix transcriptional regulator n=1 Tax=Pseudolactococcus carnosus TaxID=2749961 RepID=UPI001FBB4CBC|nr:helix-turn-helix transcriptional regulator [Lactococcus carnosus]MCJ1996831.1 helix-turn-helix transcriptional regulator [Lactococcus carnosus]
MSKEYGNYLKSVLKSQKMTQVELAKRLGIQQQAVSRWIRSERTPKEKTQAEISKILNVPLKTPVDIAIEEAYKEMKEDGYLPVSLIDMAFYEFYSSAELIAHGHSIDSAEDMEKFLSYTTDWIDKLQSIQDIAKKNINKK